MTLQDFKARLRDGNLAGFYIITGEEDYLKGYYRREFVRAAAGDETFAMFNHVSFDGDDTELVAIRDSLYAPPMMSDFKVVEWRNAPIDSLKEGEIKLLLEIAEGKDDFPYAVFVITARTGAFETTERKPSKLHTRLQAGGFDVLVLDKSTDAQLLSWLKRHFDKEGIKVSADTLSLMLFRVGHSMEQLDREVVKLSSYAKAGGRDYVSSEDVSEICSATVECEAFALSNAIIEKNMEKAFLALTDMKAQRIEPTVVLAQLAKTYSDLLSISLFMDEGMEADMIATTMKFHPYKLSLYMRAAKKLGTRALSASLEALVKCDGAAKMGGNRGFGPIEMFITQNI